MIKLKTDCEKCIHKKVCGNKGNPEEAMVRLSNDIYGTDPNDVSSWEQMMKRKNVDIVFSCPDFDMGPVYLNNGYRR